MKRLFVAAVAGTMFAATPVLAAGDGGPYVGAGVGSYGVDVGAFSGDDTGYKVFAGWMFSPFIGGELEYIDGGSAEEFGAGLDMTGFNASLKAVYPIDQFSLFAKAGLYMWDADVRIAILDSCASGAIIRAKGGVHRAPFLSDASTQARGHAFLTASSANEAAQ